MESYDVIIIGTGAGGGTLARHLAPSGKRILLLERGDWLPREPHNWSSQDVFADNRYVAGSSTPLARTDARGDTFQTRTLGDGSVHEVRKNFPTADEVRATLAAAGAAAIDAGESTYFWWVRAVTP